MSQFRRLFFLLLFLVLMQNRSTGQTPEHVPHEIILKLKRPMVSQKYAASVQLPPQMVTLKKLNKRLGGRVRRLIRSKRLTRHADFDRLVKVELPSDVDERRVLDDYARDDGVAYAQLNHIFRTDGEPNDPRFRQQTALQIVRAVQAWDIQLASPHIIVGVIDTGIDYTHEDLRAALWLNTGEDLNHNGQADSSDFNGLDDDGNGFVDDVRGWDFTDAPAFPDGGDFQQPDNDPFDENGHGTSVAGLIGAVGNNGTGIAGLAYGCTLMNLRAATSLGFLEEDDVASAIVYAVENGARIINMSFGDTVASPLLRDVIRFAFQHDCVLVASAGNAHTDKIHFPSGFAETISVGATNLLDRLASFSNYGSSVDVVAPGVNLLTTVPGNEYDDFRGTSASAPLVSALAALVLSKTPDLPNEAVKGVITSSATDLGEPGWDNFFAAGRIDAAQAVAAPSFSVARITSPRLDQGIASGTIQVRGTATGAFLSQFVLELGVGETPEMWTELTRMANQQVVDAPLFDLDTAALLDTVYTLRLIVENTRGPAVEDKIRFFVDRTAPHISAFRRTPMLDGDRPSELIQFDTDDLSDASIHVRQAGSAEDFRQIKLRFRSRRHRFLLTQEASSGTAEFFLEAVNPAGLATVEDNSGTFFVADLTAPPVGGPPVSELGGVFPRAFLLSKPADFDGDGSQEVVVNEYDGDFNFGALKIFEFAGGGFREVFSTHEVLIPRDWGDSDGDGLPEILAGRGPSSFILEAATPAAFPTQVVWSDSNDVWASRFADLDRDGKGELILRLDDVFTVWETVGDNTYAQVATLPNPTAGQNGVGVPRSELGDFDGDGKSEILMGDYDGDIYLYENRGDDRYEFTWSDRMPLLDTIDYLSHGDYDGDGVEEFVVGSHSDPSLNSQSEFEARHWLYRIYKHTRDDEFAPVWEQAFFGFQSPQDFDAGVSSGDVDSDGRPEVLISVFPDFYLVDYDSAAASYGAIWHAAPARSNATVVADFDRDGANEFYFDTGETVASFRLASTFTGPPTPSALTARPLDSTLVRLTWLPQNSPDGFRVYRGTDPQALNFLASAARPLFLDSTVRPGVHYWYTVTAVDSSRSPVESLPADAVNVTPGVRPFVQMATFSSPDQIEVTFSTQMDASVADQSHFDIEDIGTPTSAVRHKGGKQVILTSPEDLPAGLHRVSVRDVFDSAGTPIDPRRSTAEFVVPQRSPAPYLVRATLLSQTKILLQFNAPLDPASTSDVQNYTIRPNIKVISAGLSPDDPRSVLLQTDPSSPIGPLGVAYVVTVRNVQSQEGVAVRPGVGDSAGLIFSSPDLTDVFAYPNPVRSDAPQVFVTIAGLTQEATVRILDASGRLLRTLQETDGDGGVRWDLKDEAGRAVPSGIYLFYVVGNGEKAMGKLAVLR